MASQSRLVKVGPLAMGKGDWGDMVRRGVTWLNGYMVISALAIAGIGSVLAEEVFVEQPGLHGFELRIEAQGFTCEAGTELPHHGGVDRRGHVLAPGKWAVTSHQLGGVLHGIELLEPLDNDMAGVRLVIDR